MSNQTNYFSFSGRSSRSEYWAVWLITLAVIFGLGFTVGFSAAAAGLDGNTSGIGAGIMLLLAGIAVGTWVMLANIARRCRDAGISPWWTLAALVPYVGFIAQVVFGTLATDETRGNV